MNLKGIKIQDVLSAIGIVLLFATLLKEVFGVSVIGKKIYKGAPLFWKWIIKSATYKKEMQLMMTEVREDMKQVKTQVEYNGGSSMKDAVRRIEDLLEFTVLRLDIIDESNDRMNFRTDSFGAYITVNDAFLKYFGYSEKDVLGFAWESIVDEADIKAVQEKWNRAISKSSRFYSEHGICDIEGKCHDCTVRAYPICEKNNLKGFYGTIDINNKK